MYWHLLIVPLSWILWQILISYCKFIMPKALKWGILHICTLFIYQDIPNHKYNLFKWDRRYQKSFWNYLTFKKAINFEKSPTYLLSKCQIKWGMFQIFPVKPSHEPIEPITVTSLEKPGGRKLVKWQWGDFLDNSRRPAFKIRSVLKLTSKAEIKVPQSLPQFTTPAAQCSSS